MKTRILLLVAALLFFTVKANIYAQGAVFTYQGRVFDNGTNFSGAGQFQFALVTSSNINSQATATAILSGSFVTGYTVTDGGSGYTSAPAVTITGGGGSGATATAVISGGVVTAVNAVLAGSGYTSPPLVTIAAPAANIAYTTYWSNDGTSVDGSEPTTAVSVSVNEGLFTVALGDSALANMAAIPADIFATQPDLQLRIWFNDGVNGFAALSPAQNLTPAPYAVVAGNASNLLGTLPVLQLSGTIATTQLPNTVLTNGAADVTLSGTFSGDGAGVTNVSLLSVGPEGTFSQAPLLHFSPGIALDVGLGQFSVVAADVNGDGALDLISANADNDTLTVLTNNGHGVFGSNATLNVGKYPFSVVAADVNDDGALDLICANEGDDTLTVLTNNGHGVFGSNATLNVGHIPYYVVAADIVAGGKPALIASSTFSDTLIVYTNNGSGVFGSNATLTVGSMPNEVAVGDVNGDGSPDLVSANYGSNTLTVLTNNGSGVFGSNATLNVGAGPVSVVAVDVNGDGSLDLVCANTGVNTVTVLTNNGSGIFGSNATYSIGVKPQSIVAADLNGDGWPDLISANTDDSSLTVLTNNGRGVFGFYATINVGYGPWQVVAADLNGDGVPDLVSANIDTNTLTEVLTFRQGLAMNGPVVFTDTGDLFNGNGIGLMDLDASQLLTGTVPLGRLPGEVIIDFETNVYLSGAFSGTFSGTSSGTFSGNGTDLTLSSDVALLDANQTFTGNDVFAGGFTVNTGAGTVAFEAEEAIVPGIVATSSIDSGHMRFRNALEIWPNKAGTSGGYLDVRGLSGAQTIVLTGTNGVVSATSFLSTCDRNVKENFAPIDTQEILDRVAGLPISEWSFKLDSATRHIGPTAQDFHAAFNIGTDDKHIATVDEEGVALAAIKGLHQEIAQQARAKDAEIHALQERNDALARRLEVLEATFNSLAAKK
jgi:hypothetical protein